MAELTTIARPYAQAVFKLAKEQSKIPQWSEFLKFLGAVAADVNMKRLLQNPKIESSRLVSFVLDLCGDKATPTTSNLVKLLAENKRLTLVPEISVLYEQYRSEAESTVRAQMYSAFPVTDAQRQSVIAGLEKRLARKVELECVTDVTLMGGVVIRAGDLVIDGSVRGKLTRMVTALNH
jgi:F-type H+-transporting ATPase subunit delta